MGFGRDARKEREQEGQDNPFISLLLLLAFLTFCFIVSVPALLLIRFLQ